jgi:hypothetical protein
MADPDMVVASFCEAKRESKGHRCDSKRHHWAEFDVYQFPISDRLIDADVKRRRMQKVRTGIRRMNESSRAPLNLHSIHSTDRE